MIRQKQAISLLRQYFQHNNRHSKRFFHVSYCVYLRKATSVRRISEVQAPQTVAGEFQVQPNRPTNTNFYGIESDEGVIHITEKSKNTSDNFIHKYETDKSIEKVKITNFGAVRLDKENKVLKHGQYENLDTSEFSNFEVYRFSKRRMPFSPNADDVENHLTSEQDVRDDETQQDNVKLMNSANSHLDVKSQNLQNKSPKTRVSGSPSFIDGCYFGDEVLNNERISKELSDDQFTVKPPVFDKRSAKINLDAAKETGGESFFDQNYFESAYLENKNISETMMTSSEKDRNTSLKNLDCTTELNISEFQDHIPNDKSRNHLTDEKKMQHNVTLSKKSVEENQSYIDQFYFNDELLNKDVYGKTEMQAVDSIKSQDMGISEIEKYSFDTFSENRHEKDPKSGLNDKVWDKNIYEKTKQQEDVKTYLKSDLTKESIALKPSHKFNERLSSLNTEHPKKKNQFLYQTETIPVEKVCDSLSSNSRILSKHTGSRLQMTGERQNRKPIPFCELQNQGLKNEINKEYEKIPDEAESAYDFVKHLRQEKKLTQQPYKGGVIKPGTELLDSKGFRILKNQVPNLMYFTRDEMLKLLVQNVLYSDDDVVVLNKPYSLVIHESETTKDPCLSSYLDDLAITLDKSSKNPKLYTVHRLDKETTGCLLLARNESSAERLKSLFAERKIIKTYWIVTIKVPDPLQGVIDIPISEGKIDNRSRMVLDPVIPKDVRYKSHSKHGKRAVTQYSVIAESGNAALVEVRPETGIKHQIRVHFGFGLSCPILGDHKYTYLDKLVPQKIPADLLQRLHVRQSKVRYIPMHIYARSISIPQYKEGNNLYISAPLPLHISKNLQRLKFKRKNSRKMYIGEPLD